MRATALPAAALVFDVQNAEGVASGVLRERRSVLCVQEVLCFVPVSFPLAPHVTDGSSGDLLDSPQ